MAAAPSEASRPLLVGFCFASATMPPPLALLVGGKIVFSHSRLPWQQPFNVKQLVRRKLAQLQGQLQAAGGGCFVLDPVDGARMLSTLDCPIAAALVDGANRQELAVRRVANCCVILLADLVSCYEKSGHGAGMHDGPAGDESKAEPLPVNDIISCFSGLGVGAALRLELHTTTSPDVYEPDVWRIDSACLEWRADAIGQWLAGGWVEPAMAAGHTSGSLPGGWWWCAACLLQLLLRLKWLPAALSCPCSYGLGKAYFEGEGPDKPTSLLRHGTRSEQRICLERQLEPVLPMPEGWEGLVAVQLAQIEGMDSVQVMRELQQLRSLIG